MGKVIDAPTNNKQMNPRDFNHPDDYAKAFALAHPGYFPTYFSSFACGWAVIRETEKAVMTHDSDYKGSWFPKSQVVVEDGKVVGIKKAWYQRMQYKATAQRGF